MDGEQQQLLLLQLVVLLLRLQMQQLQQLLVQRERWQKAAGLCREALQQSWQQQQAMHRQPL